MRVIFTTLFRLDHNNGLVRTDYKPIDISNSDPFDGKKGFVSQISDVNTGISLLSLVIETYFLAVSPGLSYTINMDLGNCTIDYLTNDESGSVVIHDGHIHIENPFFEMNYDLFAFNGVVKNYEIFHLLHFIFQRQDRSVDIDSYLRDHLPHHATDDQQNVTEVFYLSRY